MQVIGAVGNAEELKTVYEYFTEGGIQSGLHGDTPGFF